jgi:hypothetical protein
LQLFGQLPELRQYKVTDILDKKIIIAKRLSGCDQQQGGSSRTVVLKVLHKSAAVYKRHGTHLKHIDSVAGSRG